VNYDRVFIFFVQVWVIRVCVFSRCLSFVLVSVQPFGIVFGTRVCVPEYSEMIPRVFGIIKQIKILHSRLFFTPRTNQPQDKREYFDGTTCKETSEDKTSNSSLRWWEKEGSEEKVP